MTLTMIVNGLMKCIKMVGNLVWTHIEIVAVVSLILIMLAPATGLLKMAACLGAGLAMGFGAIGPGIGDGLVARYANLGVARDPKNMGLLTRTMIIGQAITETTDIYAMVVSLILIFVI